MGNVLREQIIKDHITSIIRNANIHPERWEAAVEDARIFVKTQIKQAITPDEVDLVDLIETFDRENPFED